MKGIQKAFWWPWPWLSLNKLAHWLHRSEGLFHIFGHIWNIFLGMDPTTVRAYLQTSCSALGFDIGEVWWCRKEGESILHTHPLSVLQGLFFSILIIDSYELVPS